MNSRDMENVTPYGYRGFSLIEVMITVAIISVGILGMLGLQMTALQMANETAHQVTANVLLQDMVGRIHANAADANNGLSSNYQLLGTTPGQPTNANCLSSTNSCPSAKMAIHDLGDWQTAVATGLPSGIGVVCMDTSPSTTPIAPAALSSSCTAPGANPSPIIFSVKVAWTEHDGTPRTVIAFVQP